MKLSRSIFLSSLIVANLWALEADQKQQTIDFAADKIDEEIQGAIQKSKSTSLDNLSGFILGASMSLKKFDGEQIIKTFSMLTTSTPSLNAGLTLGYQYFFNQYAGLRISAMANVGTQARIQSQTLVPATQAGKTATVTDVLQEYLPIQANIDLKFLSTFFRNDSHAFGVSAGIGYEAEWYVVKNASATVGTSGALTQLIQQPNDLLNHGLYPEFGIYYYYKGNQFELNYRFGQFAFSDAHFKSWNLNLGDGTSLPVGTRFLFTGDIILSYLYRF
ncbi:hypothetical protein [Helicobacter pametensis]|uniref:hypothetical protein n=1 Tax=Helicobacter pametensis TaxID=95149 RepID=UPI0004816D37|nr:hypothetical protein [Helicobacter pametensis]